MVTRTFVCVVVLFVNLGWAQEAKPRSENAERANQAGAEMSPAFREMAMRASDAIERLPPAISERDKGDNFDTLILDAKKAVDEAKYKATLPADKKMLRRLQADVTLADTLRLYEVLDPRWKQVQDVRVQCWAEVQYALNPNSLNEKGKTQALKDSCSSEALKLYESTDPK